MSEYLVRRAGGGVGSWDEKGKSKREEAGASLLHVLHRLKTVV